MLFIFSPLMTLSPQLTLYDIHYVLINYFWSITIFFDIQHPQLMLKSYFKKENIKEKLGEISICIYLNIYCIKNNICH